MAPTMTPTWWRVAAAVLLYVLTFAVPPVSASHSPGGHRAEFVRLRSTRRADCGIASDSCDTSHHMPTQRREATAMSDSSAELPLLGQGLVQMTIRSEQTSDVDEYSVVLFNKAVDNAGPQPAFTIRVFSSTNSKGAGVSISMNDNSVIANQTILKELQETVPWAPDDLVKFSQSSIEVWVSVDKKNGYIRFGYGYPLLENTMVEMGPVDSPLQSCLTEEFATLCPIFNIATANTTLGDVENAITKFPIVNHEPHLLVDSQHNTLHILSTGSAVVPATLPAELQELYALVGGDDVVMTKEDAANIDYCVKTEGCILYKILEEKKSASEFGSPDMVYVRATIGPDLGNSPGSPLVVEIWPPGCYSPIHDHADTVAVIKVLSGTITSTFYNPLAELRNGLPVPLREGDVTKGQVTYLTPELFQTHMLKNNQDATCITIQSYYYLSSDYVHNETFHFTESPPPVNSEDSDPADPEWDSLHLFKPGSDIQYEDAIQQARDFSNRKRKSQKGEL